MEKINNWVVTVIGVLLVLPLVGIDQLGNIGQAGTVTGWLIALGVLYLGVSKLLGK